MLLKNVTNIHFIIIPILLFCCLVTDSSAMPRNATYMAHHTHQGYDSGPTMGEAMLQKLQSSSRRRRPQYTPTFASRTPATDGEQLSWDLSVGHESRLFTLVCVWAMHCMHSGLSWSLNCVLVSSMLSASVLFLIHPLMFSEGYTVCTYGLV